jgi:hypothetical protein
LMLAVAARRLAFRFDPDRRPLRSKPNQFGPVRT